jgi:hypothetical protein
MEVLRVFKKYIAQNLPYIKAGVGVGVDLDFARLYGGLHCFARGDGSRLTRVCRLFRSGMLCPPLSWTGAGLGLSVYTIAWAFARILSFIH